MSEEKESSTPEIKASVEPKTEEPPDSEDTETLSPRIRLIRDAATLQVKLMIDGFRDAILIPVSIIAALLGFLRGGDEPDREFQSVLKLGRRSERWINLFGRQNLMDEEQHVNSIDQILEQAEAVVVEQYKKGRPATNGEPAEDHQSIDKEV